MAVGEQVQVRASSEHGRLRSVVMCLAVPMELSWRHIQVLDPPTLRQMRHNRWRTYDADLVRAQQRAFIDVLKAHDVEVHLVTAARGAFSQHYTRDIGFVVDDAFVVARPRREARQYEIAALRPLLQRMSHVAYLDAGSIEGGDVLLDDGVVIVGLGEETSPVGVDALRHRLEDLGIEREVRPIRFSHRGIIHLDTKFNIVGPEIALVEPTAFERESLAWLAQRYDLVAVTPAEARALHVNTFSIDPATVVMPAGSDRVAAEVERRGITPVLLDYSEVGRLPGSFRCTTLPLRRDDA